MPRRAAGRSSYRLLLAPFVVFALGAPGSAQPAPPVNIQANADEVTVDLVARDKKGRIVTDLRPEDLRVLDQGEPVHLTSLRKQAVDGSPRRVILLFDSLPADSARLAGEAALEMLRSAGESIDFAILTMSPRVRMVEQFSHDRNRIARSVDEVTRAIKGRSSLGGDAPENALRVLADDPGPNSATARENDLLDSTGTPAQMTVMLRRALGESQESAMSQMAMPGLRVLLSLSQRLGGVAGRKTIVYFSDAPPADARSRAFQEQVAAAANRGSVSVYAFDVSGISIWSRTQSARIRTAAESSVMTPDMTPPHPLNTGNLDSLDFQERSLRSGPSPSALRNLTFSTGGFLVENSNDMRKAARRVMDDVNSYYDATYIPPAASGPAPFRSITVTSTRPGIRIQARSGYSRRDAVAAETETFETPLFSALGAADLPAELDVHASVLSLGPASNGRVAATLAVEVPLAGILLQEDADSRFFSMHFAVLAAVRDHTGAIVFKTSRDVPYRGALSPETRQDTYSFAVPFQAAPGEYTLESALLDLNTGKRGARRGSVRLEVPAQDPCLSDLSVVRRFEPATGDSEAPDLFRFRNARVIPDLTREFDPLRASPIWVFFLARVEPSRDVTVFLEIQREGRPLSRSELKPAGAPQAGAIPFIASLNASHLAPGRYQIFASANPGGENAFRSVAFDVSGPPVVEDAAVSPSESPASDAVPQDQAEAIQLVQPPESALPGPVPDASEQRRILEGGRRRALGFTDSLPNFTCIESTRRYIGNDGDSWKTRDSFAELLEFVNGVEKRTTLEVNGAPSRLLRSEIDGAASAGEYGSILRAVFGPEADASFVWNQWSSVNGRALAVFTFHIDVTHSRYALRAGGRTLNAGAHGLVYIDPASMVVHRVTMFADEIPKWFAYRESSVSVDYDFVTIGELDYALPTAAEVQIRRANGSRQRNLLTFRDYQRFGARSSITFTQK